MSAREILDLKHGLQAGQVVPYFQPQIDLRTGQVCRFEALARWHHPVHGLVGPDVFIPLAEAGDLIGALTEKVVSAAATIAVGWPESVKLAVNVSPLELRDWSLPDRLQSAVQKTGFPMNRLVVEITESALVGNVELAQPIAADLKQAGASLALDDFGTGSSSLHHLQALPFDEIKVDASFVRSMEQCRQSRKIVAAVVGLGNSLGLTTVAEGVEEQVQADILVCLGCDYGQGWLFGHAVPPGELDTDSLKFYPRDRVRPFSGSAALQLEARPAERRAQLQAIYDGAPVGLCFLDRSLRYGSLAAP
jgi:EAL domain-containing protein (putative c-di-GMP-specific phosphodiesterase class I)